MGSLEKQKGVSILSLLAIMIMVGFFVMCVIKMAPAYFEYLSIKEIVNKTADQYDPQSDSISEIRMKIDNLFNTNQIYGMRARDVEVYRKDGKTYIDANHEIRIPIMGRIDAVLKFDDLQVIAGQRRLD
ncbi:MAG: DUF4845 domain-containing protein [Pseudomonadota bacterium]